MSILSLPDHHRQDTTITNRRGQQVICSRYHGEGHKELAVFAHGFSGNRFERHLQHFARIYFNNGYDILLYDASNNSNASDGEIEDNSIETHLHDLEDVITWAKLQDWFTTPYALAGHSLGSFAALLHAQDNPDDVKHLFPCSALISGRHLYEAYKLGYPEATLRSWQDDGYMEHVTSMGEKRTKPFSWLEDMQGWSALDRAERLHMPVLLITGTNDIPTPPDHQRDLLNALPIPKALHIIDGADHVFSRDSELEEAGIHQEAWLKDYDGQAVKAGHSQ